MTDIKYIPNTRIVNIIGSRFGYLTVISFYGKIKKSIYWRCYCDCGKEKNIFSGSLKYGISVSCGCMKKELQRLAQSKHGMRYSTEYNSWKSMKGRCLNSSNPAYKNYGGRGITICDRWLQSFENFLEDMGKKPTPQHSIDRIDNSKGYEKSNCRWATPKEQNNNKRNSKNV